MSDRPHVVIIGGGFGGLAAARALGKAPVRVTLIDRRNHHLFQPLLYQVATAALNPGDIAYPIRGILHKQANTRVLLAEARRIDVARKHIELDDGALDYDYLIVATGATHSYFGKDWGQVAPGLKSIEDALEIRRRVFLAYEAAEREPDPLKQRALLTFVVVGAGPTGVELAGALGEIGLHTLANDFRRIDPKTVRVLLLEGRDRVLPPYSPKLSAAAHASIEKRRVEVRTNTMVTQVDAEGVTVQSGPPEKRVTERIAARTVLWAAGVQASPLAGQLGAPIDRAGRAEVAPDLTIPGHPEVFVIGDMAKMIDKGKEVPGVAQGAIQGGRFAARLIVDELAARSAGSIKGSAVPARPAFHYRDKGSMATIGRASAVVSTLRVEISGFFAWLMWWVVHIALLVGFRSRLLVMMQWAWSWLTFQRGARLITGTIGPLPPLVDLKPDGTLALPRPAELVELDPEASAPPRSAAPPN
jgi:NADH dehydrogenase